MRYRLALGFSMMAAMGGALAQTPAPASSSAAPQVLPAAGAADTWRAGADTFSDAGDRAGGEAAPAKERFKFKDREKPSYVTDGPGNPVDRDKVLGTEKPSWEDGRPPLNCSMSPLDPACRH